MAAVPRGPLTRLGRAGLALLALLLLAVPAAGATGADDVADALRSDPVYVQSGSGVPLDADRVRDAIREGGGGVYVAALPARAWQAQRGSTAAAKKDLLVSLVGQDLGDDATLLLLFGDRSARGGSGPLAQQRGVQGSVLAAELAGGTWDEASVTERVVEFVRRASAGTDSSSGGSGPYSPIDGDGSSGSSSGPSGLVVLGVLGAAGAVVALVVVRRSRARRRRLDEENRADVESLYDRLGSDVSTLSPGDDAVARHALADAAERYGATGALMAKADTPGEWAAARRTAVEGLTAARVVRQRLGLDLGPDLPAPPAAGPVLTERTTVAVGDQQVEGSPAYEPGRQHWFGGGLVGGRYVPGGWYGVPFWETVLVTSVLTGGLGGLGGGDGNYADGWSDAQDEARRDGGWSSGGADWGSGGDSGGGDWGGGGSGGDGGSSW